MTSEPQSVIETRLVHDMHRRASTLLAEVAARPSVDPTATGELRDFLVAHLHHHHESEDRDLWPMIERVAPGSGEPLGDLSAEHRELDTALDRLAGAPVTAEVDGRKDLAAAAAQVRDVVHRHLEHEEPVLFPVLRTHLTQAMWAPFAKKVIETTPPVGAQLLVAFFDEVGTPEEVELVLSGLPEPVLAMVPAMLEQGRAQLNGLRGGTAG